MQALSCWVAAGAGQSLPVLSKGPLGPPGSLLVEDKPDVRSVAARALREEDEVVEASHGTQGWELVQDLPRRFAGLELVGM